MYSYFGHMSLQKNLSAIFLLWEENKIYFSERMVIILYFNIKPRKSRHLLAINYVLNGEFLKKIFF